MKALAIFICLIVSSTPPSIAEDWELVKDKAGIKVYVTKLPNSAYYAFKAEMKVKSSVSEINDILREVELYPEWFAFSKKVQLIRQSKQTQQFYMETDYPWPYANECMEYAMEFHQTDNRLLVTIDGKKRPLDCKHSLKKASGYILLEVAEEQTTITFYFHSEPSQNIPPWLINPMIDTMPYQTFTALRNRLDKHLNVHKK